MKFNIGYPDIIYNDTFLQSFYDVTIIFRKIFNEKVCYLFFLFKFELSPDTYLENGLTILRKTIEREVKMLREPFNVRY